MSYKSEKFQQVKDLIKQVDKNADFSVNFDTNKMQVYTRSFDKESEILHSFRINNIIAKKETSKDYLRFNIEL